MSICPTLLRVRTVRMQTRTVRMDPSSRTCCSNRVPQVKLNLLYSRVPRHLRTSEAARKVPVMIQPQHHNSRAAVVLTPSSCARYVKCPSAARTTLMCTKSSTVEAALALMPNKMLQLMQCLNVSVQSEVCKSPVLLLQCLNEKCR